MKNKESKTKKKTMEERNFKGIWIPKDIWLDKELTPTDKCILAEIDSLDNDLEKGCFASNSYLAEFFGMKEGSIANSISKLKKKGYITQLYFDGRNRGLRLTPNESRVHFKMKADLTNKLRQTSSESEYSIKVSKKNKTKNNISSQSSENNKVLEEKQTQDVLVSESLTKNIDGNCTLTSQDITKPIKPKKESKYLKNPDKYNFIAEKTKYWNDNSPESVKIRPKRKGEESSNDWCLGKLYDLVGREKAEVVFEAVMCMPNRKAFWLVADGILEQTLATYQDPNQETPKYLSNEAYKRQSHYKGGNVPDEKMIPSEATFYASLEWHFSDRYEGAELVKKVREFIQENNCKFKNY